MRTTQASFFLFMSLSLSIPPDLARTPARRRSLAICKSQSLDEPGAAHIHPHRIRETTASRRGGLDLCAHLPHHYQTGSVAGLRPSLQRLHRSPSPPCIYITAREAELFQRKKSTGHLSKKSTGHLSASNCLNLWRYRDTSLSPAGRRYRARKASVTVSVRKMGRRSIQRSVTWWRLSGPSRQGPRGTTRWSAGKGEKACKIPHYRGQSNPNGGGEHLNTQDVGHRRTRRAVHVVN